jgi:hypothetical protein
MGTNWRSAPFWCEYVIRIEKCLIVQFRLIIDYSTSILELNNILFTEHTYDS